MLYELLTGEKPHEGESPIQVAYKHVHEDVPPPSALVPGLPAYVDALVARATARDREQRPADAGVLLHQLHRVSQALADGVGEDPELTADLVPRCSAPTTGEPVPVGRRRVRDTSRGPVDSRRVRGADGAAPGRRTTTSVDRPAAEQRPARTGPPARRPAPKTPRPRRSRRGPVLLVLALAARGRGRRGRLVVRLGPVHLDPSVLGLAQAGRGGAAGGRRAGREIGDTAYSETVAAGRVIEHRPGPGERVLDGGAVTVVAVARQGALRGATTAGSPRTRRRTR